MRGVHGPLSLLRACSHAVVVSAAQYEEPAGAAGRVDPECPCRRQRTDRTQRLAYQAADPLLYPGTFGHRRNWGGSPVDRRPSMYPKLLSAVCKWHLSPNGQSRFASQCLQRELRKLLPADGTLDGSALADIAPLTLRGKLRVPALCA